MNKLARSLEGIYAITPDSLMASPPALRVAVEAALQGGISMLQFRAKQLAPAAQLQRAHDLRAMTREYGVPLIVNDDLLLAQEIAADGVHLGRSDASLAEARSRLGPQAIVGVTCHDNLAYARQAEADGASYVAFGRFFPSRSKPLAPAAGLDVLSQAALQLKLPICAIGGVDAQNIAQLVPRGAQLLAVIAAIFGAADVRGATQELLAHYCLARDRYKQP